MRMKTALIYLCVIILAGLLSACVGRQGKQASGSLNAEITVATATSMKLVMSDIAEEFERETGARVNLSFGSSGLLARQIENGAPIDVFISADKTFVDQLKTKKLTSITSPYARGFIVFYGQAKASDELISPNIERIAIANPNQSPYGRAAVEILKNNRVWPKIQDKIVYADNVSQAYEFTKTGNADAGIVALSLIKQTDAKYTVINKRDYKPLVQWLALIRKADDPKTGKAFVKFMHSNFSKKALIAAGFKPVEPR